MVIQGHTNGPLGSSRIERVHVRSSLDPERLEPFDLVRSVDADNDPPLAALAVRGMLHQLPDGTLLAEPFRYHARSARLLVLVIPMEARHREMEARHALLSELDELGSVPSYALDFRVVLGAQGLCAALGLVDPVRPPALADTVTDEELHELAEVEEVQALEGLDEVQELQELREIDTAEGVEGVEEVALATTGDVTEPRVDETSEGDAVNLDEVDEVDEVDDEDQVSELGDADEDSDAQDSLQDNPLAADEAPVRDDRGAGASEPVDEDDLEDEMTRAEELVDLTDVTEVADVHDVHDIEDLADVYLVSEGDVEGAEGASSAPLVHSFLDGVPDTFGLVSADWVIDDDDDFDDEEALTLDEADLVVVPESYSTLDELAAALPVGVSPPADFTTDPRRLRAGMFKGKVWLFAKSTPDVFERDGLDVAVQQLSVGGRSIALIALADLTADRSEVLRLATDLGATGPRALLGVLSRDFVVSVAFFREGRTPHRCVQLRSGRESNVARILALPAQPEPDAVDIETAIARALAAPPPLDSTEHPFRAQRAPMAAPELKAEVRTVARWLEPSRLDRVRLGLGVPERAVNDYCKATLEDAIQQGIALPPLLMQLAVSLGLADDPAEIVAKQLDAFFELTSEAERGGLRDVDVDSNWSALRGAASAFSVELPPNVQELLRAMDSGLSADDPGDLQAVSVATLLELLRRASHRRVAAVELLRRDAGGHAEAVGMALRDMRRDDVLATVAAMRSAGATLVPTLLDTLTAKKTFVRQAAAFSLAALQAEEAVPALIKLVARENTSLWEEFARALAAFGDVAIDSIVEAVEADSLPAERAALALAYLAKGGFASPVEELSAHSDPRVSAVATAVSTRIPTVEGHLREFYEAGVNPTGPREFGKRLFQALHPDPARRA